MPAVPPAKQQRRQAIRSLLPYICPTNKLAFGQRSRAESKAEQAGARYDTEFDVYRCPKCGGFHLATATSGRFRPDWPGTRGAGTL